MPLRYFSEAVKYCTYTVPVELALEVWYTVVLSRDKYVPSWDCHIQRHVTGHYVLSTQIIIKGTVNEIFDPLVLKN